MLVGSATHMPDGLISLMERYHCWLLGARPLLSAKRLRNSATAKPLFAPALMYVSGAVSAVLRLAISTAAAASFQRDEGQRERRATARARSHVDACSSATARVAKSQSSTRIDRPVCARNDAAVTKGKRGQSYLIRTFIIVVDT